MTVARSHSPMPPTYPIPQHNETRLPHALHSGRNRRKSHASLIGMAG